MKFDSDDNIFKGKNMVILMFFVFLIIVTVYGLVNNNTNDSYDGNDVNNNLFENGNNENIDNSSNNSTNVNNEIINGNIPDNSDVNSDENKNENENNFNEEVYEEESTNDDNTSDNVIENSNQTTNSTNTNSGNSSNNTSVITKPTNGVIKNSTKTSYGFTYKEGIYPVNTVKENYEGTCELQVRETTSSTSRSVYYYKWNYNNGKYEKVTTKTNGIKYINSSKVDGKTYMQWYLIIDGVKYYTPIYERNCATPNSEIALTADYISSVNSKYSNSDTKIDPKDSILITTANYQVTLRTFNSNSEVAKNVLNDIKSKYVFTAPHSVKQWRNNDFKVADVKTGVICETLAKITNSVCISRTQFDKTDPNIDSYADSEFQQLVVYLVNNKSSRTLVDVHGLANRDDFDFAVGTRNGNSLYSGDRCVLEKKFTTAINNYAPGTVASLNNYNNYDCGFNNVSNAIITKSYNGGALIINTKNNVSVSNFSSVQIEISNYYRSSVDTMSKIINSIYYFVKS